MSQSSFPMSAFSRGFSALSGASWIGAALPQKESLAGLYHNAKERFGRDTPDAGLGIVKGANDKEFLTLFYGLPKNIQEVGLTHCDEWRSEYIQKLVYLMDVSPCHLLDDNDPYNRMLRGLSGYMGQLDSPTTSIAHFGVLVLTGVICVSRGTLAEEDFHQEIERAGQLLDKNLSIVHPYDEEIGILIRDCPEYLEKPYGPLLHLSGQIKFPSDGIPPSSIVQKFVDVALDPKMFPLIADELRSCDFSRDMMPTVYLPWLTKNKKILNGGSLSDADKRTMYSLTACFLSGKWETLNELYFSQYDEVRPVRFNEPKQSASCPKNYADVRLSDLHLYWGDTIEKLGAWDAATRFTHCADPRVSLIRFSPDSAQRCCGVAPSKIKEQKIMEWVSRALNYINADNDIVDLVLIEDVMNQAVDIVTNPLWKKLQDTFDKGGQGAILDDWVHSHLTGLQYMLDGKTLIEVALDPVLKINPEHIKDFAEYVAADKENTDVAYQLLRSVRTQYKNVLKALPQCEYDPEAPLWKLFAALTAHENLMQGEATTHLLSFHSINPDKVPAENYFALKPIELFKKIQRLVNSSNGISVLPKSAPKQDPEERLLLNALKAACHSKKGNFEESWGILKGLIKDHDLKPITRTLISKRVLISNLIKIIAENPEEGKVLMLALAETATRPNPYSEIVSLLQPEEASANTADKRIKIPQGKILNPEHFTGDKKVVVISPHLRPENIPLEEAVRTVEIKHPGERTTVLTSGFFAGLTKGVVVILDLKGLSHSKFYQIQNDLKGKKVPFYLSFFGNTGLGQLAGDACKFNPEGLPLLSEVKNK